MAGRPKVELYQYGNDLILTKAVEKYKNLNV